jgi:hypothetical protein
MKWFFCWCQDTDFRDDHNWKDLIRVAVASARQNTDLEPNFIYDGEESEFIDELRANGVNVIFHRLSFTGAIISHYPDSKTSQAVARGAFLRFDIPLLAAATDEFVLYTDADVMFLDNPRFQGYYPLFIAAAPQFNRGQRADMNSGVMLLNLKTFRAIHEKLIDFTTRNLHLGLDQEILRVFLGQDYLLLPDIYNWKPYWGVNDEAPIVHWHGPKPETIGALLSGKISTTHAAWLPLFERDKPSYEHYLRKHDEILSSYRKLQFVRSAAQNAHGALLSRGKPASQSSYLADPEFLAQAATRGGATGGVIDGARKFHTDFEENPWWQVDLGGFATIREIHIYNTNGHTAARFRNFSLGVSIDGESWSELVRKEDDEVVGGVGSAPFIWNGPGTAWARFVRVTLLGRDYLHLDQVEVFGAMTHPGGRV